jgi:hypothetical protein
MANSSFDDQIRARIRSFTEELAELVRQSALESLRAALGAPEKRGPGRRRAVDAALFARAGSRLAKGGARRGAGAGRAIARAKGAKRDPEQLAQLTDSLHGYIKGNPGQRIEEIARGMGTTTKELNLPVKKLIGGKQIKTKGHKRATQYYPK